MATNVYSIRLTDEDHATLERHAQQLGFKTATALVTDMARQLAGRLGGGTHSYAPGVQATHRITIDQLRVEYHSIRHHDGTVYKLGRVDWDKALDLFVQTNNLEDKGPEGRSAAAETLIKAALTQLGYVFPRTTEGYTFYNTSDPARGKPPGTPLVRCLVLPHPQRNTAEMLVDETLHEAAFHARGVSVPTLRDP